MYLSWLSGSEVTCVPPHRSPLTTNKRPSRQGQRKDHMRHSPRNRSSTGRFDNGIGDEYTEASSKASTMAQTHGHVFIASWGLPHHTAPHPYQVPTTVPGYPGCHPNTPLAIFDMTTEVGLHTQGNERLFVFKIDPRPMWPWKNL